MQKQIGAIMLVAGTCIGSGMIALPMTLVKIGIVPSVLFMIFTWMLVYFSALITTELNLQAGKGMALGALGRKFSGKIVEIIGTSSFKVLSYALVAVYIYAGSSVIQKLLESSALKEYSFNIIANIYSLIIGLIFLLPIKFIDYVNRFLFVGLLIVIGILIVGLVSVINWSNLPLFTENYDNISAWQILIPIVFTSFGFQGSCHSFANYCNLNVKTLRRALFWGSCIPMVVYIIWNSGTLSVVYNENPVFYQQMLNGNVEVGDLIKELSNIAKWPSLQILVWWTSILAIVTSILGVGIGLYDSIKDMLPQKTNKITVVLLTILPAHLLALFVPHAFTTILGFAGMILAIIAIMLPAYLFYKIKASKINYPILKSKILMTLIVISGGIVILCEIFNILG